MICEFPVTTLIRRGIAANNLVVITFYKDQYECLEEFVTRIGANRSTVDSVQGREEDVVIVLITKTHFNPEGAEFRGDPRRTNVALTKCRHGHSCWAIEIPRATPFWKTVLDWARTTTRHTIDKLLAGVNTESVHLAC